MKINTLVFAAAMVAGGCPAGRAHEVTVYSTITMEGRHSAIPAPEQPVNCILLNGGCQRLGDADSNPPATPARLVLDAVARSLDRNGFHGVRQPNETSQLLVVCHWGRATPPPFGAGPEFNYARAEMLALVGGSALGSVASPAERDTIVTAANDERYFVIVSAYDYAAYAAKNARTLLWRTQMSVPSYGLTPEQAWPILAAAGGALFGRETSVPRRIEVGGTGILKPVAWRH